MNKKSRRMIGATAMIVGDLIKGRLTGGFFFVNGNWRKVKGGNATVLETFVNGSWENILIFNKNTYGSKTLVLNIEY